MAITCLTCFPKRSASLNILRLLRQTYCEQKLIKLSASEHSIKNKNAPVKYTTNKASTVTIAETTGLDTEKGISKFTAYLLFISFGVFMVYFCYLREENDIDEILKGNIPAENEQITLLNLKLQLSYCENNNLPTHLLKVKIKELEEKQEKIPKSPFRK